MSQVLRLLIVGLAALLFAGAGVARATPPPGQAPPCHMTMAAEHQGHAPANPGKPRPDMMAMNCCLACLPTPALTVAAATPLRRPAPAVFALSRDRFEGRVLAPELGPPRTA